MADIDTLRELAGKAAPGPWIIPFGGASDGRDQWCFVSASRPSGLFRKEADGTFTEEPPRKTATICWVVTTEKDGCSNAAFIAACDPQTILALLDENERLRAALVPFANFAEKAERYVEGRATFGGSPVMPTKHFRLADFQRAKAALAHP